MPKPRTQIYYYQQFETACSFKRNNWALIFFVAPELTLEVVLSTEAKLLASPHDGRIAHRPTKTSRIWPRNRYLLLTSLTPSHPPALHLTSNRHTNAPTVALSSYSHRGHNNGATTAATTPRRIDRTATPQDPHADRAVASNLVHCRHSTDTFHGARGREEV